MWRCIVSLTYLIILFGSGNRYNIRSYQLASTIAPTDSVGADGLMLLVPGIETNLQCSLTGGVLNVYASFERVYC